MHALSGSVLELGATSYSSTGFPTNRDVLYANGAGSSIALPNISTLDAGFGGANDGSRHAVWANGGNINLSGLLNVVTPQQPFNFLLFQADSGGSIDLTSLGSITSAGDGWISFYIDSATLTLGEFRPAARAAMGIANSASAATVTVLGDVDPIGTTAIDITGGTSELSVGADFTLAAPSDLDMTEARLRVGGNVDYARSTNGTSAAADSIVYLDGVGEQRLEIGGPNLGVPSGDLTDDHFTVGQLVVEGGALPVDAALACSESAAGQGALYLQGLSATGELSLNPLGLDGLRILNGSTLDLGGFQVYAYVSGSWQHLNALLPGVGVVEYDDGFISASDSDSDGVSDALDNCPSVANLDQADGAGGLEIPADGVGDACDNCVNVANRRVGCAYLRENPWATLTGGQRDDDHDGFGNVCDGDFPGTSQGGNVGAADVAQFKASNGEAKTGDTCGTNNLRPCAIYDLNSANSTESTLNISAADVARFKVLNGSPAGPKCAACTGTGSAALPCTAGASGSCGPP